MHIKIRQLVAAILVVGLIWMSVPSSAVAIVTVDTNASIRIELDNTFFSPRQYVTIPFKISNAISGTYMANLSVDDKVLVSNLLEVKSAELSSQFRTTMPETLVDGTHTLSISLVKDEKIIGKASRPMEVRLPNLGLKANDRLLSQTDVINIPANQSEASITFSTVSPDEEIASIVTSTQTIPAKGNKKVLSLSLEKAQAEDCLITVRSACGSQDRQYAVKLIRGNDVTALNISLLAESGKQYTATLKGNCYELCLPPAEAKGKLMIQVQNSTAQIKTLDGVTQAGKQLDADIVLSTDADIYYSVVVTADGSTMEYSIHITNVNFTPSVAIRNASEIAGATYSSQGIKRGVFVDYGNKATTVNEAILAGKTHGLIIALTVEDVNIGQYLAGYLDIQGEHHAVHWGSFDGPTVASSGEPLKGFIYIDSTYFQEDIPSASYSLRVEDYEDAALTKRLSSTPRTLTFAVQVNVEKFAAYFDSSTQEVILSQEVHGFYTYKVSTNGGVTWSEPMLATTSIKVTTAGTTLYEITLEDDMKNTRSKIVTANIPKQGTELNDVNIFLSTTRQADYIYINTKKINSTSIDLDIFSLFTTGG